MKSSAVTFIDRLNVGPAFLLLGQRGATTASQPDPLFAACAQVMGIDSIEAFEDVPVDRLTEFLGHLAGTGRDAETSADLRALADYPWNGVFTTMVDSRLRRGLASENRRVSTAVGNQRIEHPRSSLDLTLRLLFGGVDEPPERQPPTSLLELTDQRSQAMQTLFAMATELITPRGVVAIEGWAQGDWLRPEDLYSFLSRLQTGQAHWFSVSNQALDDEYIRGALAAGVLVAHEEPLTSVLNLARQTGRLHPPDPDRGSSSHLLRLGDRAVAVPRDEWARILPTARPVDVDLLTPPPRLGEDLEYDRFREFLGASDGAPDWAGIAAGYPFRRSFEDELQRVVAARLGGVDLGPPVIVEGQAGAGKSIALSVLAARLASAGDVAVLHLGKRGNRPNVSAIDAFALWAEEEGDVSTLVVWDGMLDSDDYYAAHHQLRARGRKVLIVGSAHRLATPRAGAVLVSGKLERDEPDRIQSWLTRFDVDLTDDDLKHIAADSSFLAALYRILPESRQALERGLNLELRAVELDMATHTQISPDETDDGLSVMAAALLQAGVELVAFAPVDDDRPFNERDFEDRSTAEQLTGMVLVAGRRGLRIPLELAMRVIGSEGISAVLETTKRYDIIRWSDDELGDQYLGSRTALEAELLARQDFRDVRAEVLVLVSMLRHIKPQPGFGGAEVQFAVDVLSRVGPGSPDGSRFRRHYPALAEALAEVRATPSRANPRLMLLEANLLREYVMAAQRGQWTDSTSRLELLGAARTVLEAALEEVRSPQLRLSLLTELASTLGSTLFERADDADDLDGSLAALAGDVVSLSNQARELDPENFYPVDVIAWVCMRVSRTGSVEPDDQVGLIADTLAAFASIDPQALSPSQRAQYDSRLVQVAGLLNDSSMAEDHLRELRSNGDPAAYYLLALHEAGLLLGTPTDSSAERGLRLLSEAPEAVRHDWRCARLALDLFWIARSGTRFLRGERESLHFDDATWQEALQLLDSIQLAPADQHRAAFMRGLALFHLGQYRLALDIFRELDRSATTLSRRVIATYLLSDANGTALRLTGQVRSVTPDFRRGRVWVDDLGIELPFIPYRFAREGLERGDLLPDFYVAFNFRGPYADPVRTARPAERTKTSE